MFTGDKEKVGEKSSHRSNKDRIKLASTFRFFALICRSTNTFAPFLFLYKGTHGKINIGYCESFKIEHKTKENKNIGFLSPVTRRR